MAGQIDQRNSKQNMRPATTIAGVSIADQSKTVSNTAVAMLGTALDENTTHVLWTTTTDAARYTIDGSNPTTTNGHYVAANTTDVWHRKMAESAKWIKITNDVGLHISELQS